MKHEAGHVTPGRAAARVLTRHPRTRLMAGALLGCLTVGLAGCSSGLTAQSSCKDFLNAAPSGQVQAIDKIAPQ